MQLNYVIDENKQEALLCSSSSPLYAICGTVLARALSGGHFTMSSSVNEDMISKLAAQFNTLPEMLRAAIGDYVPADESPCFYKGYVTGMMMVATLLNEQKIPVNYDMLVAIAGKAAQLRQQLLEEEEDTAWLDQLNAWVDANYKTEATRTH
jgi:hypothetical protein